MSEHEKLKSICEDIWYKYVFIENWALSIYDDDYKIWFVHFKDVREIIFTQDFIEKYISYIDKNISPWIFVKREKWELVIPEIHDWLIRNLDNPVDYLYNLIKNTWDTN